MPRQLITEQQEQPDEDLPELTAQQQEFVRLILDGKSGSDAYRGAYDTSGMMQRTIWAEASRTRNNPSVAAWLAAARKACMGTATMTMDSHLQELERLRELAVEKGNLGAAVQAEQIRGKVKGYHVDQIKDVTDRTDVTRTLKEIAEHSPELAASLAASAGIEWQVPQGETRH